MDYGCSIVQTFGAYRNSDKPICTIQKGCKKNMSEFRGSKEPPTGFPRKCVGLSSIAMAPCVRLPEAFRCPIITGCSITRIATCLVIYLTTRVDSVPDVWLRPDDRGTLRHQMSGPCRMSVTYTTNTAPMTKKWLGL